MTAKRDPSPLARQVLAGSNEQLQMLAAEGLLPLALEELLPLQVALAASANEGVAQRARDSLRRVDPKVAADFLTHEADTETLAYFAVEVDVAAIQEALLRRRDVPRYLLADLAPRLSPDLQEILLLRQDAIVEEPAILDGLEENPRLSSYSARRIAEYRQHLVPIGAAPPRAAPVPAPVEPPVPEATVEQVEAAIEIVKALPRKGEVDDVTDLSETQIKALPLPVRMRLSRGASRGLRNILIKDSHPLVAVSVIMNNAYSDMEIEQVARNRSVIEDVLEAIGRRREWVRKYPILLALATNPRTPSAIAVKLIPQLAVRDLRNLARDRNVPDLVRTTAARLYRIKTS